MDRRKRKTRNSIRKAFNELLLKKDYISITITEIAALADIDRKTFYLHYNSIDSILKEFQEEESCKVRDLLKDEKEIDIGLKNNLIMENG